MNDASRTRDHHVRLFDRMGLADELYMLKTGGAAIKRQVLWRRGKA
jgi:hypothetical protein